MLRPSMRAWLQRFRGELAYLEKGILGRTRPEAHAAVREALALCGTEPWCRGCGKTLSRVRDARDQPASGSRFLCADCGARPLFSGFIRLGRYASPLDRLVQRVKARAWHDVAEALGRELARVLEREHPTLTGRWVLAPIPSSALRRWWRGIDHTDAMAKGFCAELGIPRVHCLKARRVARQASLSREERLRHARLGWRGRRLVPQGAGVILLDDIRTTGATLLKARELVVAHGAGLVIPAVVCVRDDP